MSSMFPRRELGVEVWAVDLWITPSENLRRIRDAGVEDGVFPLRANARALPFAAGFFDAVVAIDSFVYFGTDDLYLAELARFLKPGGVLAIAGAGVLEELDGDVPEHLREWWEPSLACLHSPGWWRRHWERTGIVTVERADAMEDGWRYWLAWQRAVSPGNAVEIAAVEADAGALLGYVRAIARKRADVKLDEPIVASPERYERHPLLRERA
jgi:SAM-dependent methyltransferase